jgi:rhodanese-related sulfurtransferase
LRLAGSLLVGGFVANLIATHVHPAGHEDDFPVIFAKYADSDAWVAVHLVQFAAVLVVLGGFLALHRVLRLRREAPVLALCALGCTVATAAVWAALQGIDGVALKQAVDAWANASGAEKAMRFADASTVRWAEWGLNSYFRLLLGLTVVLFGLAIARTALVAPWLGWAGLLGGLLYMASGVAVGYAGFESDFESAVGAGAQLLFVVLVVGVLVSGVRSAA